MAVHYDSSGDSFTETGEWRIPRPGEPYLSHNPGSPRVQRGHDGMGAAHAILAPVVRSGRWEVADELGG
jgi:hypothetical protein